MVILNSMKFLWWVEQGSFGPHFFWKPTNKVIILSRWQPCVFMAGKLHALQTCDKHFLRSFSPSAASCPWRSEGWGSTRNVVATTSAHTAPYPECGYFTYLRNTRWGCGFKCCGTGSVVGLSSLLHTEMGWDPSQGPSASHFSALLSPERLMLYICSTIVGWKPDI